ncbi:MAG TPA: 2-dehydropantoate 2-reductase [Thermoanaerobaculia bacterium]|nr:2-dehydropantoate 2-reductase [Thermoanaerobaculia bacterium]
MRIAVVGAGGVGGYYGGRLAQAGSDVTFLVRGATLDAMRTNGLRVKSIAGDFTLDHVNATDDPSTVGEVDAIVMTVKSWQLAEAARSLAPMIGRDTAVVPLENGIEAPEELAAIVGRDHVLGGLCGIVSFRVAPGHIRHIGAEPTAMFGELDHRRTQRVEALLEAFRRAGIKTDVPPDIIRSMWTKFLFIAPLSGIGAITRVPIGAWRTMPGTRALVERALHEVIALATARGIDLGHDAIEKTFARYDGLTPESTSSLQRDVMEGKPSELDAQIGAVVRLGRESNVPTPIHEFFYECLLPQELRAREG